MNMGQAYAGSWEKKFCSGLGKEVPGSGESYKVKYFDHIFDKPWVAHHRTLT